MAYAQENRKNEIGLLLGATVTPALDIAGPVSNRVEIGSGITFQLTYARQLARTRSLAWYFEVPALAIPLQDITASNGVVPKNYDSFFITPALRAKLAPFAHVSPWFSAEEAMLFSMRVRTASTERITLHEERAEAQ
jgi:hypothetical protein